MDTLRCVEVDTWEVVHCHEGATNASNCREKNMGVMKAWAVLCVALVLTGMGCLSTADQLNDRALNGRVTTEPMAMAMKSKVGAQDEKLSALKKTDADLKKEVSVEKADFATCGLFANAKV